LPKSDPRREGLVLPGVNFKITRYIVSATGGKIIEVWYHRAKFECHLPQVLETGNYACLGWYYRNQAHDKRQDSRSYLAHIQIPPMPNKLSLTLAAIRKSANRQFFG